MTGKVKLSILILLVLLTLAPPTQVFATQDFATQTFSTQTFDTQTAHCVEISNPLCDDGDPWNGYWLEWGGRKVWVPGIPTVGSWFMPSPTWTYGNGLFYGPGVMEGTARERGFDLTGYLDGVALMSPADLGMEVWLRRPGYAWEGPFLVVDASARNHMYPHVGPKEDGFREEVAEVGWKTAVRWGMTEDGTFVDEDRVHMWRIENLEVSKVHPYQCCLSKETKVYYPGWWLESMEFSKIKDPYNPQYELPHRWRFFGGYDDDGEPWYYWVEYQAPVCTCVLQRN